jgi:hypothetical protein
VHNQRVIMTPAYVRRPDLKELAPMPGFTENIAARL